jgi:hypothetical protein
MVEWIGVVAFGALLAYMEWSKPPHTGASILVSSV